MRSSGAEVSSFKVRIKNPRSTPSEGKAMISLPISKRDMIKIGLSSIKLIKKSIPRVDYHVLTDVSSDGIAVAIIDDLSTVKMLGYKGVEFLLDKGCFLIYVSHNFYDLSKKDRTMEAYVMNRVFVSIVASERDKFLYRQKYGLSEDKVVVYPNIYPIHLPPVQYANRKLGSKKHSKTTVVLNMGSKVSDAVCRSLIEVVNNATVDIKDAQRIRFLIIGSNLVQHASKLSWRHEIELRDHIPDRRAFLEELSAGHIGVNYAYKAAGSNIKKYDYALAGLVVLSNIYGCKGENLPHEWVFYDEADLYVKLIDLVGKDLTKLGIENREHALLEAQKRYDHLQNKLADLL